MKYLRSLIRKRMHIYYVENCIIDLKYSIINQTTTLRHSSYIDLLALQNKVILLHKYQKHLKWIKF
jgi:hypothetical protein